MKVVSKSCHSSAGLVANLLNVDVAPTETMRFSVAKEQLQPNCSQAMIGVDQCEDFNNELSINS